MMSNNWLSQAGRKHYHRRVRNFFFAIFAPLLWLPLKAAGDWKGTASATYHASSTLHEWTGQARSSPFVAAVELKDGAPARLRTKVEFPVSGIGSENEKRDANMRAAMKAAEHPLVTGAFDAELPAAFLAGEEAELPVDVTLLGRTHRLKCKATRWRSAGGEASFDVEFPISLEAVGIDIPSFLLLVRVHDAVLVRTHVTLSSR
jgi:hypothetical protein